MSEIQFEKDDSGIRVHERGVIAQLCAPFRSHEQGLPEWFKNSSAQYVRENIATEHRVLTLFFGHHRVLKEPYIALLDHGGMTVQDVEEKFANWGDPSAHLTEADTEEVIEGGHGNGGKCYMTQMFARISYLHTVRSGRGSRYGFLGGDPHPGYFPNRKDGRGFPIGRSTDELRRVLGELNVDWPHLPDEVKLTTASRNGFTLVVGIGPKQMSSKDAWRKLVVDAINDPQMMLTAQSNRIFVLHNGKAVGYMCPVKLPEIEPHDFAKDPRIIEIPEDLLDPETEELCVMTPPGAPHGKLVIRTAKTAMTRAAKRSRHHIRYMAYGRPVGFLPMDEISRSHWGDRMYGECFLDVLCDYETNDRSRLARAPVSRALEHWIRLQVDEYEDEFKQRQRLEASQEKRNRLQELNSFFDNWKNRFLDDTSFLAGGAGNGVRPPPPPRPPRPANRPVSVTVKCPFHKAGVGVWIRTSVEFRDEKGIRVEPLAYQWHSTDWAVATVDAGHGVVTHAPGVVEVWVETLDGSLRSNSVRIEVLDLVRAEINPPSIELQASKFHQLSVAATDREGSQHEDVYMTWVQDDSSVVSVTATGKLMGRKPGTTTVYAMDERCIDYPGACHVTILSADTGPGDDTGKAYPRILLSEIDPDPLNPDGEPYILSPEDGPVHQPTPQHVDNNIWFINLQCPMAKFYFESYGQDSREWRSYHIERYIEALAKIRLGIDYQLAEEDMNFEEVERRWREIASEVQRRAVDELRVVLEGGELPGG